MLFLNKRFVILSVSFDFVCPEVTQALLNGLVAHPGLDRPLSLELVCFLRSHGQLVVALCEFRLYVLRLLFLHSHLVESDFFSFLVLYFFPGSDLVYPFLNFGVDRLTPCVLLFHEFLVIMFGLEVFSEIFFAAIFGDSSESLSL